MSCVNFSIEARRFLNSPIIKKQQQQQQQRLVIDHEKPKSALTNIVYELIYAILAITSIYRIVIRREQLADLFHETFDIKQTGLNERPFANYGRNSRPLQTKILNITTVYNIQQIDPLIIVSQPAAKRTELFTATLFTKAKLKMEKRLVAQIVGQLLTQIVEPCLYISFVRSNSVPSSS